MAVSRADKEAERQQIEVAFKGAEHVILLDYKGLTVSEAGELRRQVRAARAQYRVVKNTLAKRALAGTVVEPLSEFFQGTTAVAYSGDDPVALAKALTSFAKVAPVLTVESGRRARASPDAGGGDRARSAPKHAGALRDAPAPAAGRDGPSRERAERGAEGSRERVGPGGTQEED